MKLGKRAKAVALSSIGAGLFVAHVLSDFMPDGLANLIAAFVFGGVGGFLVGSLFRSSIKKASPSSSSDG
jgi:hypothetical protein